MKFFQLRSPISDYDVISNPRNVYSTISGIK